MNETSLKRQLSAAVLGVSAFHAAFAHPNLGFLILFHFGALLEFRKAGSFRRAFYPALVVALFCFGPQLWFFQSIFGIAAVVLWLIVGLWTALFCGLLQQFHTRWGTNSIAVAVLAPILWTGFEYFRSEVYYLKFSWFTPGFAFAFHPARHWILGGGTYLVGFVAMAIAAVGTLLQFKVRCIHYATATVAIAALGLISEPSKIDDKESQAPVVNLLGIQMEYPGLKEILDSLDEAVRKHPESDLIVLSEYSFGGEIPDAVKAWCKKTRKHLIAGGKDKAPSKFYNTAFVIDPEGKVVFKQVKSVPIQFFDDGLPAPEQAAWNSPWGKIGICICYDLNYRKVVDRLAQLGVGLIVCPTMDVVGWGERQHALHSRTVPMRSSELRIPTFRVASSGISQIVLGNGAILARAEFPGQGEVIFGKLKLTAPRKQLPVDHWIAPACTASAMAITIYLLLKSLVAKRSNAASTNQNNVVAQPPHEG